jgi:hypothetical protein
VKVIESNNETMEGIETEVVIREVERE